MPRPGFVLDVDRSTPPILFHHGEGFRLEKLPPGRSRVIYPAEPIEPLAAVAQVEGHVLAERPHTVLVGRGVAEGVDLGDLPGGQRGDRCDPPGVTVVPRRCRHTRHAVKPRPGSGRAPDEGTTRTRRDDPNPEV